LRYARAQLNPKRKRPSPRQRPTKLRLLQHRSQPRPRRAPKRQRIRPPKRRLWLDSPQIDAEACKPLAEAAPKSLSIETAIKDALRFMMQGDAKAAHAAFCFATERGAQTKTVLMGQAQVLLMQMDYRGALQVIGRELQLRPSWAAQDLRGDALIRLGQVEEAKQAWFAGAGATQGSDLLIKNLLRANKAATQTSVRAGDLRRAERTLRRTIALAPRDAESCLQLADVLDKLDRAPAAARWRAYATTL
jgi:Flp pilus assembly protein TadD